MAKHGLTISSMAKVVGISYQSMWSKLHGKNEFTLSEAKKIVKYFNSLGEDHTVEGIFFNSAQEETGRVAK